MTILNQELQMMVRDLEKCPHPDANVAAKLGERLRKGSHSYELMLHIWNRFSYFHRLSADPGYRVADLPQTINLKEEIRRLQPLIETRTGDKVIAGADTLPELIVLADKALLANALFNLLYNATDYALPPEITGDSISVRISGQIHDGKALLRIQNRSPRLPDEEFEALCRPFYRAPSNRSQNRYGTGIGLFLANAIVKAQGGELILTQEPCPETDKFVFFTATITLDAVSKEK